MAGKYKKLWSYISIVVVSENKDIGLFLFLEKKLILKIKKAIWNRDNDN